MRRVYKYVGVLMVVVVAGLAAFGVRRARLARREVAVARNFVTAGRALSGGVEEPFACTRPLESARAEKRIFGRVDLVAYVKPGLPGLMSEQLMSPDGCLEHPDILEFMEGWAGSWWEQAQSPFFTPVSSWRRLAFDPVELMPLCMSTTMTDVGVVVLPRMAEDEAGTVSGELELSVSDLATGTELCRGRVDATFTLAGVSEAGRRNAIASQLGKFLEELLGV